MTEKNENDPVDQMQAAMKAAEACARSNEAVHRDAEACGTSYELFG
jgi:hypothetical protein